MSGVNGVMTDDRRAQKQRQDEERAAREAALAEEQRLAKLKAEEDAKERHRRQEEERQRRDAAKRAAQEEASRKEAERRKRQEEERTREEEAARKKREREEKIKKEREAREREAKEKERRDREEKERLAKEKAEKDRAAREAREKAEKERQAKLEEERLEKQRREAAEQQRKMIAAQQAAREKAAAEKAAAAERAERAKAAAAAAVRPPPGVGPNRKTSLPPPISARNGPSPPGQSPAPIQSPPTPSSIRPPASRGPPKTPQPFGGFQQPVPAMASYSARPSQAPPPGFGPSFARPPFPSQSPVFQQPANGQMFAASSSSSSPSSAPRFGGPPETPGFDSFEASRPTLGVGYPSKSGAPSRVSSTSDDPFRAGPIGQRVPSQPSGSMFATSSEQDDFLSPRDPIGPPGPIGSRPGAFDPSPVPPPTAAPGAGAPGGASRTSPAQPDQVFGSAALGDDDEIVQPAARRPAPSWGKMPPMPTMSSAPGAGRWSAAPPNIWGMESTPWNRGSSAAPGFGSGAGAVGSVGGVGSIAGVTSGISNLGVSGSSTAFGAPGGPLSPAAGMLSPNEYRQAELAPGAPPGLGIPHHQHQHGQHGQLDPRRAPSYGAAPGPSPFFQGSNLFGPQ